MIYNNAIIYKLSSPNTTTIYFGTSINENIKQIHSNLKKKYMIIKLENEDSAPKLSANVKNMSLFSIPEIDFVSMLYDEKGNVVNGSRTFLEKLDGETISTINFTWPQPFKEKVVSKEIIPIFNIFSVKLN